MWRRDAHRPSVTKLIPVRGLLRRHGPHLLFAVVVIAAAVRRLGGFTSHSLWFDDAWAALPARESLSHALSMSVSTPLWTLAERWWIMVGPDATYWAQLPSYIFGVVGTVVMFPVLRRFGASAWAASLGASIFAVNPMMTTYSTRVKPYTLEVVCALIAYLCAESALRHQSRKALWWLAVVSVLATFSSFGVLTTIGTIWLVILWQARRDRVVLRQRLAYALPAGVLASIVVVPYVLSKPPSLSDNWVRRGYMFGYDSWHQFAHNAISIFAGFPHSFFNIAYRLKYDPGHSHHYGLVYFLAAASVVVVLLFTRWWRHEPLVDRRRWWVVGAIIPASFLAAVVGAFPFGDGRTDLVMYPAVVLVGTLVLERVVRRRLESPRVARIGVVLLIVLAVALPTQQLWSRPARYPTVEVKSLLTYVESQWRPGDVIVVPAFLTYTWAYDGVTPWHLEVGGPDQWPQGFRVVSDDPRVIVPVAWTGNDPQLATLAKNYRRVWYVGYTVGVWSPYGLPANQPGVPMPNFTSGALEQAGWRVSWFSHYSDNTYVTPMEFRPSTPVDPLL